MKPISEAPGPTPWLPATLLWQLRRRPLAFLSELSAEYGNVVQFRIGGRQICLFNDPDLVEEVLVKQNKSLVKGQALQRARRLLGNGLLTNEGPDHLRQRRLMQPAFHKEQITAYANTMIRFSEREAGRWQDGQTIDIHEAMMRLTLAIVGQTLFQADIEEDAPQVGAALEVLLGQFRRLISPLAPILEQLPTPANQRYQAALDQLNDLVAELITERRHSGDQGDLLSMLLMAQEDGQGMSDEQLRDEVMTLLLAGHETTANALSWTWYLLGQHPEVAERLYAEWDALFAGRAPTFAAIPQLSYTRQVFSEALRLYPPAWIIGRQAVTDVTIGEYEVPAGATILVSQYLMHHHPRYYPEPERFDPERWTAEATAERPKFAFFPFGAGARFCIGERFAWMEGLLLLATIGQQWQISIIPGTDVQPSPQVTLRPAEGLPVRVHRRTVRSGPSGNCATAAIGQQLDCAHDAIDPIADPAHA